MDDDPLDDRPPGPGPNGCPKGGLCDGSGWCPTSPKYVEWVAGEKAKAQRITDPKLIAQMVAWEKQYSYVYPCKRCNTVAFFRWAGGHWNTDHDDLACDECIESRGGRRQVARRRRAVSAAGAASE